MGYFNGFQKKLALQYKKNEHGKNNSSQYFKHNNNPFTFITWLHLLHDKETTPVILLTFQGILDVFMDVFFNVLYIYACISHLFSTAPNSYTE